MRVFMCEFETGGGVRREGVSPALLREGAMMRDALARDLGDIAGVEIVTTHDDRAPAPTFGESVPVGPGTDVWALWAALAATADLAWIVAPEYAGSLSRMSSVVRATGVPLIGPDDETIRIASSKRLTADRLAAHGVPTPIVWRPGSVPADAVGPFVTKPDDGAGCENIRLIDTAGEANAAPADHVVQPFTPGEAASLTVLRAGGVTRVLAANRQHVVVREGAFSFRGVSVAALEDRRGTLAALAGAVTDALPGLSGIFGIDLVLGEAGPIVVEVNPRLTTAFAGLREAIGVNPATLVPPFATGEALNASKTRCVEVAL